MSKMNWEKPKNGVLVVPQVGAAANRLKFGVASLALLGVVAFLLVSGTANNGRYFITVNALLARPELAGKSVKITGAVVGSTIQNDPTTQTIHFTLANVNDDPAELDKSGGLSKALYTAVNDPNATRLNVVVVNQPMPDLLRDQAQAILTGTLGADGIFHADEILFKCPSRYQADLPGQAAQASN